MRFWLKPCLAVYWLALSLWLAALISLGIAAIGVFAVLDGMPMALERFEQMPPSGHGRLAAGLIMAQVALTADVLQASAGVLTVVTLALQVLVFKVSLRRWSNLLRGACIITAALLFAYEVVTVAKPFSQAQRDYWDAAERGAMDEAAAAKASLDRYHRRAEAIHRGNLLLLLVAVAASAVALGPRSGGAADAPQRPRLLTQPPP